MALGVNQNKLESWSLAGISSLIYCLMSLDAYGIASDLNKLESWYLAGISSLIECLVSVGGSVLEKVTQNKLERWYLADSSLF
jgi:hypothetical protein